MKYTKTMAQQATRNQIRASYVNVWEYISGEKTDRKTAIKKLQAWARNEAIPVHEIFDEYKALNDVYMAEKELDGYFCF